MDKFGLQLVKKAHENDIKGKAEKVVVTLHWCLLSRGLRCVGLGDNFSENEASLSELLPENWTKDLNSSTFKYRQLTNTPNKFLFKIIKDEQLLNIILLRLSDEATKAISVDLASEVAEETSNDDDALIQKAFIGLLDEFLPIPKEKPDAKKARVETQPSEPGPSGMRNPHVGPDYDPLRIGGSDLDPLGRHGGGGMILDPPGFGPGGNRFRPRFDPVYPGMPNPGFNPPGFRGRGGRGGGRNFGDEFPPPDYDDMFM